MKLLHAASAVTLALSALITLPGQANAVTDTRLVNWQTQKCVAPYQAKTTNGTMLVQYTCSNSPLQVWSNIEMYTGVWVLYNEGAQKCATEYSGADTAGTYLTLWDCNGAGQNFAMQEEGEIVDEEGPYDPPLVWSVDGGSMENNAHITVWPYQQGNFWEGWYFDSPHN